MAERAGKWWCLQGLAAECNNRDKHVNIPLTAPPGGWPTIDELEAVQVPPGLIAQGRARNCAGASSAAF